MTAASDGAHVAGEPSAWRTVKRPIDVAKAFREAMVDVENKQALPAVNTTRDGVGDEIHPLMPLDAIPLLAVPHAQIAWDELDALSIELLSRVDGATSTMWLVIGTGAAPGDGARVLARLAARGFVRVVRLDTEA